jgi:hypothetical protein
MEPHGINSETLTAQKRWSWAYEHGTNSESQLEQAHRSKVLESCSLLKILRGAGCYSSWETWKTDLTLTWNLDYWGPEVQEQSCISTTTWASSRDNHQESFHDPCRGTILQLQRRKVTCAAGKRRGRQASPPRQREECRKDLESSKSKSWNVEKWKNWILNK